MTPAQTNRRHCKQKPRLHADTGALRAEGKGFEPFVSLPTTVFKTATFGRSVNPPVRRHCCASAGPRPNRTGLRPAPSGAAPSVPDYGVATLRLLLVCFCTQSALLCPADHPPGAYRGPMRAMVITDDGGMAPSD